MTTYMRSSWPGRLLILALLSGVLAMHALTVGHDPAYAVSHDLTPAAGHDPDHAVTHDLDHAVTHDPDHAVTHAAAVAIDTAVRAPGVLPDVMDRPNGSGGAMTVAGPAIPLTQVQLQVAPATGTACLPACGDHTPLGAGHSTTAMCLAVLAALGFAVATWLVLAARRFEPPLRRTAASTQDGWWQPLLSEAPRPYALCVLRT